MKTLYWLYRELYDTTERLCFILNDPEFIPNAKFDKFSLAQREHINNLVSKIKALQAQIKTKKAKKK